MSCQNRDMKNLNNYCKPVRSERTQFDKDLQNLWCSSCCGQTGPVGPAQTPNRKRYTSATEEKDSQNRPKVSGVY